MAEMRLIDANTVVTIQVFDEMTEEYNMETITVAKAIDRWSDEGCPPTIDAVPVVHGRWSDPFIGGYDGLHAVYYMTCSKCMREVRHSVFRYCPNCGAKMDGGMNV